MAAAPPQSPRPVTPPLPTGPTFDQELCRLVLDTAPRLFAVVQVRGEGLPDVDGWVAAWGRRPQRASARHQHRRAGAIDPHVS